MGFEKNREVKKNMAELNERIRIARTLAGLSQDDVAKALDVQRSVVVRYEQERKPADSSLEKLATLTGMPMPWFWMKPVTGILTFCPELPGREYSHPQVRQKETAINRDWPLLLDILAIKDVLILRCDLGGIAIAYNDDVCVVVCGTHTVDSIRRVSAEMGINVTAQACETVDFLDCWMQPEFSYLKKILSIGTDLDRFVATIPDGEFLSNFTQWGIELEVGGDTDDDYTRPSEHDQKLIKQIENFLTEECALTVLNVSIKRLETIVPGAPQNWKFKKLVNP